jgi:ABC-type sugar transport system substrate-binding protein
MVDAPRVGILLGDFGNSFWHAMKREYEALESEYGLQLTIRWADPERDPVVQAAALSEMVAEGYDALITNPITHDALVEPILAAAAAGIPVFDVGGKTEAALVIDAGDAFIPVLTVDFAEQGRMGGAYIAERLAASGRRGTVVCMLGRPGSKQSVGRMDGARETLAACENVLRLTEVYGRFDESVAANAAAAALDADEDVAAFFCVNDLMALATSEVARKRSADIIVVGVDGTEEGLAAVADGRLDATVAFSPNDVAHVLLGAVRGVLNGGRGPVGHAVSSRLVAKEAL